MTVFLFISRFLGGTVLSYFQSTNSLSLSLSVTYILHQLQVFFLVTLSCNKLYSTLLTMPFQFNRASH